MSTPRIRVTGHCPCGNTFECRPYELKRKRTCSKACRYKYAPRLTTRPELRRWKNVTHINGAYHPLHGVWRNMISRCHNVKHKNYRRYGGRGIRVCQAWQDWDRFHDWAMVHGYRRGLCIDRNDNDGDYSPLNCRWVSWSENEQNRSNTPSVIVTFKDGRSSVYPTAIQAASALGISDACVRRAAGKKLNSRRLNDIGASVSYA